jgi:hypothetical protein
MTRLTNGDGVLVVAVADFASDILGVRSLVDNTLGIVNIAVVSGASRVRWVGGVRQIKEDETRKTARVAGLSANNVREVASRVGEDVVHTSKGKVIPVSGKVGVGAEGLGTFSVVDVQKLL